MSATVAHGKMHPNRSLLRAGGGRGVTGRGEGDCEGVKGIDLLMCPAAHKVIRTQNSLNGPKFFFQIHIRIHVRIYLPLFKKIVSPDVSFTCTFVPFPRGLLASLRAVLRLETTRTIHQITLLLTRITLARN